MKRKERITQSEVNLRLLVRQYDDWQKIRISLANRLKLDADGNLQKIPENQKDTWVLPAEHAKKLMLQYQTALDCENETEKDIKSYVEQCPIYDRYLKNIRCVGHMTAAYLISEIDIHESRYVTSLWKLSGFAPGFDRPVKGETLAYDAFLKRKLMGVVSPSFIKMNTSYADYYYNYKQRWEGKIIEEHDSTGNKTGEHVVTNKHRDLAARRYMMKAFLRDLYMAWRTIEGLEVFNPYEEVYKGVVHHGEKITDFKMFLDTSGKEKKRGSRKALA